MGQENSHELLDDSVPTQTLRNRNIESVAELIKEGRAERIVVLSGAGLSTAAGIPDFRSPDTGLYANLARLNLPYAEAVFDISYFREHPEPFYALAAELYPGKFKPTLGHCFISLLAEKNLLYKLFTQNIDCLERAAGVPDDKIVEAHGSFASQRCIECKTSYPDELMMKVVETGDIPHCLVSQCNGLVKPDIVFFGEALPEIFGRERPKMAEAELVIIMGTSLSVQPFASLPDFALGGVPRLLFNRERVGGLGSRTDDVCFLADCDEGVQKLAEVLGWEDELEKLWMKKSGKSKADLEKEELKSHSTKDEQLEVEVEKLTGEVDRTLKLSEGHDEELEKKPKQENLADEKKLQVTKEAETTDDLQDDRNPTVDKEVNTEEDFSQAMRASPVSTRLPFKIDLVQEADSNDSMVSERPSASNDINIATPIDKDEPRIPPGSHI